MSLMTFTPERALAMIQSTASLLQHSEDDHGIGIGPITDANGTP